MNRRQATAAIGSAGAAGILTIKDAFAGKGWCRMDPWGFFDDQLVEFWGYVWTEVNAYGYPTTVVPGSAEFWIQVPQGHSFYLDPSKPAPLCEVYTTSAPAMMDWQIKFRYQTTNGDNRGRLQIIKHDDGDIDDYDRVFTGFSHIAQFDAS